MKFLITSVVLHAGIAGGLADDIPPGDFVKLMKSLHSDVTSLEAIYEGTIQDLAGHSGGKEPIRLQGSYAMRFTGDGTDGVVEWYKIRKPGEQPLHQSLAILRGRFEDSVTEARSPQYDPAGKSRAARKQGSVYQLGGPESPQIFLWHWYFSLIERVPTEHLRYEFAGWEEIESHRCLKVRLRFSPGPDPKPADLTLWIDLERGGHPLKADFYLGGRLLTRMHQVVIERTMDANGKAVWLPLRATRDVFFDEKQGPGTETPTGRQQYGLVLGSIRINEKLPDSAFVVHNKPRKPTENATKLASIITNPQEYATPTPPRTDSVSVQKHLQKELDEASRQAKELEASSPARDAWSWTQAMQLGLAFLGVSAIGGAAFWRWKHS